MNCQKFIVRDSHPDELYRRARQIAQARRRDVTEVLAESIVLADAGEVDEMETAVDREETAFRHLHPQLWQTYRGQYVAIYQGELVDHDPDQVALFLRVKQRYGDAFVWIAPVRVEAEETAVIHSPRLEKKL